MGGQPVGIKPAVKCIPAVCIKDAPFIRVRNVFFGEPFLACIDQVPCIVKRSGGVALDEQIRRFLRMFGGVGIAFCAGFKKCFCGFR